MAAILGSILKRAIELRGKIPTNRKTALKQQLKTLRKLMKKAEFTAFGEHYKFSQKLKERNFVKHFRNDIPAHDYNSMFKNWWYRCLNGEPFVCWPNHIKYFALSSGTSEASSKHIPVTKDTLKAITKASARQALGLAHLDLPKEFFQKRVLMIGGSTHLNFNGTYYEGDLSGITTGNIPFWFQFFSKPGPRISKHKDWNSKLNDIVLNAHKWDIGIICGVPAWIQIIFEKIVEHYNVKTIHDIWPNLRIYISGGVSYTPYLASFEKLTSFPLIFLDTYLASEGYLAFQTAPNEDGTMKLLLDNGIFFEFIPFNEENFNSDGDLISNPKTLLVNEVEEGVEYAPLISTCSGAWRYLIGDTLKFTNVEESEIKITGRTKHFLSMCGEHLSVDNMNKAIILASRELGIEVNEYTVCGVPYKGLFAHHWYIGTNDSVSAEVLKNKLDEHLKILNDDYRVERGHALKEVIVDILPQQQFLDFMESKGKLGSQHKFPRVLKGKTMEDWVNFLKEKTN
ncbi:MAG TPA: GH3 auxin-responsive promoter family protein [Bacteroidia bacterium]